MRTSGFWKELILTHHRGHRDENLSRSRTQRLDMKLSLFSVNPLLIASVVRVDA